MVHIIGGNKIKNQYFLTKAAFYGRINGERVTNGACHIIYSYGNKELI